MTAEAIANLCAVVGTVLSVVMLAPQTVRLLRFGRADGVSLDWLALGFAVNAVWIAYLVAESRWGALPATSLVSANYLVTLAVVMRLQNSGQRRASTAVLATVAISVVVGIAGGWETLGVVLAVAYGVQVLPSFLEAGRAASVVGVSLTTWTIAAVEGVLWGTYGAVHDDVGIVVYGSLSLVSGVAIATRVSRRRRGAIAAAV